MAKTRRAPVLHLLLAVLALAGALSAARAEFANPSGVAVIIGNRTYAGDIPAVDYAHRDADAFRRYVVDVLGFDPENVIDLRDATQAKMWSTFGSRTPPERSELWSYLEDEGSDVVVFYSGHGAPGLDDRRGYLLPVDADPNTAELNGYPIDLLYENLARLAEPKTARVYLDACFSGGSAGGGMLIEGASPVFVEAPLPEAGGERLSVPSAASGKQLASWDRKAKHGLFTHHLLDALYGAGDADSDGQVTAREAKAYLDRHMTRAAKRTWKRRQKASFAGNPDAVLAHAGDRGAFPARPSLDDSGAVAGGAGDEPPPPETAKALEEALGLTHVQRVLVQHGLLSLGHEIGLVDGACCFPHSLVESPGDFTGLFRCRISWDDEAIRERSGEASFPMNRCYTSGEGVGARAPSVGTGWASAAHGKLLVALLVEKLIRHATAISPWGYDLATPATAQRVA